MYDPTRYTVDSSGNIRGDYLFSYWIIVWFFAYYFVKGLVSPIVALILALIENVITFVYLVISGSDVVILMKFLAMMLLIKIAPLWLLMNKRVNWINSTVAFFAVFALYNIYLWMNKTDLIEIYRKTFNSIHSNSDQTPLFKAISTATSFATSFATRSFNISSPDESH